MAKFEKKRNDRPEDAPQPQNTEASVPASAASVDLNPTGDATMAFPGDEDTTKDVPHPKDELLNAHQFRLNNKRRFLMDALCRALNCEMYLLEADKKWAPNPLGHGGKIDIRYSREFPTIYVVYDKYGVMPSPELVEFKQRLAHENGYRYIYDTPEHVLTHERLTALLAAQKHIVHPELAALNKIRTEANSGKAG